MCECERGGWWEREKEEREGISSRVARTTCWDCLQQKIFGGKQKDHLTSSLQMKLFSLKGISNTWVNMGPSKVYCSCIFVRGGDSYLQDFRGQRFLPNTYKHYPELSNGCLQTRISHFLLALCSASKTELIFMTSLHPILTMYLVW